MSGSSVAFFADLYEFTMAEAYLAEQMTAPAVFEFFVRKLPKNRNFLLAYGLEQVIAYAEGFRFGEEELGWLASLKLLAPPFLEYLAGLRFHGDINAVPEGVPFFANEPILQVRAPLPEAQLLETRIINLLQYQILIGSKAIRVREAAGDRQLIEFGMRRAHGAEAGLLAARASYLAGFDGTSAVVAGREFGIPILGTMAHSYIEAHESETEAFERFSRIHQGPVTLLLDTYDTEAAARKVARLARSAEDLRARIVAVRLDSGDLVEHARKVRAILDENGLSRVRIFGSGGLDEYEVHRLLQAGAPIDGFGVGTSLTTSKDAPMLDCAYKIQEYADRPVSKHSEGKLTMPGRKQVYRQSDTHGLFVTDEIGLANEPALTGDALLQPVMRGGVRLSAPPSLPEIRARAKEQVARLPEPLRKLDPGAYPVRFSRRLLELAKKQALYRGEPG